MEVKDIFSAKEAADYLGVSLYTLTRMEKQGQLPVIKKPGRQRRFSRVAIERYLEETDTCRAIQSYTENDPFLPLVREQNSSYVTDNARANELFFQKKSLRIYNVDFLKIRGGKDSFIDLIVTSPPYNVDIQYNSHNDTMTYDDYLSFTKEWLTKAFSVLKDDGRLCLNVPLDKNKGGQQSMCADITTIAKSIGFKYHSTIIWNEQNISRRTAWGSWLSASAPYVIAPVEVIIVLYKKEWKKTSGSRISDISKNEFLEWTNGVWNFSGESKKRVGHPAPFPIELPFRCIKLFSFVGDTILDPFLGSGSTLLACLKTDRKGIGIDIDRKYCELAQKRLVNEGQIDQLNLNFLEGVS